MGDPDRPSDVSRALPSWDVSRPPRWLPRGVLYVLLGVAGLLAARWVLGALTDFIVIVLLSLFLSFAVEPAVDWLALRGWRRGPATGVVFLAIVVGGGIFVWVMVDLVVRQVSNLVDDAPRLIREASDWVNRRFGTQITTDSIVDKVKEYQGDLAETAGNVGGRVISVTGSLVSIVFRTFTVMLFTFYLVADGPKLRRSICSVLPQERQRLVIALWELAIAKTGGYLYSRILLAMISATFNWVAFSIIGLPSPLALAMWVGVVSQFVPVVGTYIGGVLPVLIALLNDPVKALWVIGVIVVYQQFENYILAPRITARTMEIHPAVAFGSVIVGGSLLGPSGALLALPAAAIIQAFVSSYLHRYELIDNSSLTRDI